MQAQPPIYLLKPWDCLPLVDVAPTVTAVETHLTGHDRLDCGRGGGGVIARLDCSYYDNLGQELEPARTAEGRIELLLTGQGVDLCLLNEIVQHGFNALRAEAATQSPAIIVGRDQADQDISGFAKKWPVADSVRRALLPPDRDVEVPDSSEDLLMRFLAPSTNKPSAQSKGSFLHNCWHIARRIDLNSPH